MQNNSVCSVNLLKALNYILRSIGRIIINNYYLHVYFAKDVALTDQETYFYSAVVISNQVMRGRFSLSQ